ncbi:MAG: hypothetical protein WDN23_17630 [Edaphobacter sp.]
MVLARRFAVLSLAGLSVLGCGAGWAQSGGAAPQAQAAPAPPVVGSIATHPGWPVAKPEDVSSLPAIIGALYKSISGGKGETRDWDRLRSLFLPDARLIPSFPKPGAHADAFYLTVDDYIARSGPRMTASGFFERSIHNEVQQYGNIVSVWSTYESRHAAEDPAPFARGINSIQLLKDGDRYWVVNIFWDAETPGNPIPPKYLTPPPASH